jgi:hypothetical protein
METKKPNSKQSLFIGFCLVVMFIFAIPLRLYAHLRFIGPNPYFSFSTFPQDARLFGPNSSFVFLTYTNRGWLGNLDVPQLSPAPGYIATESIIVEDFDHSTLAQAGFKGTWFSPSLIMVPFVLDIKSFRIIPLVIGQLDRFRLNSSGTAIGYEDDVSYLIPFRSELSQDNTRLSYGFLATTSIDQIPIGIKVTSENFKEGDPSGHLEYTFNNVKNMYNRFNWGWSTVLGCGHIFGPPTNIDAFWQDYYIDTRYSTLDVTIGANFKKNKAGFHFRQQKGEYGYYGYNEEQNGYEKFQWSDRVKKTMWRGYDVFKILNIGKAELFMVGLVELDVTRNPVIYQGIELEDMYREDKYGIELLPFLHFDLPDQGFFRIGTSVSFFKSDYAYREVWGGQEVYSSGWMTFDWEQWWERSSYGDSSVFTNFSEADLELVLSSKSKLTLISHLWSHLSYITTHRYYGNTISDENGVYRFIKSAERTNTLRELWIGGTFGFQVGKKWSVGIFVDLPIHYDVFRTTEITGSEGEYFKGSSNDQPTIRKPVQLRLLVILNW